MHFHLQQWTSFVAAKEYQLCIMPNHVSKSAYRIGFFPVWVRKNTVSQVPGQTSQSALGREI